MLTEEERKNLKSGDKLLLEVEFDRLSDAGHLWVNTTPVDKAWVPDCRVSLPSTKTKHDPTRLFKKGDKVRVVAWNGRKLNDGVDMPDIVEVEYDERPGARDVSVFWKGYGIWGKAHMPQCFLELVTPVEELYMVHSIVGDNGKTAFFAVRKGDVTVAAFFCDTPRAFIEEQARAAAEAECARLNEEWRKEQK